jgi:uncharacterized cupredoxin-like copper-binding protein
MRSITDRHPMAVLLAAAALAVALAGCGGDDTADTATETAEAAGAGDSTTDMSDMGSDMEDMDAEHEDFAFGEPADAADADRTIQVEAQDAFAFDPDAITVDVDEVVSFEIHNGGEIPHEFVLGPEDVQTEHESEMADMGDEAMEHAEANAIEVPAGETATLTWRFTEAGEVLYGCHEPGHYGAGMVGTITVE